MKTLQIQKLRISKSQIYRKMNCHLKMKKLISTELEKTIKKNLEKISDLGKTNVDWKDLILDNSSSNLTPSYRETDLEKMI